MTTETVVYEPSPWGLKYHSLPHDEALGAGAAGPGKTTVLIAEPLAQIKVEHERQNNPDHPYPVPKGESQGWALFLRRQAVELDQVIARTHRLYKAIDPGAKWWAGNSMWEFSSGYKITMGHCQNSNDWTRYYSNEYTLIMFDELVYFEEEQYDQIITRLRKADPVLSKMLKVRSMSNPQTGTSSSGVRVKKPNWVRDYFVEPAPEGEVTLRRDIVLEDGRTEHRTRIYLPARLRDNPDKAFVRNYELTLQSAKPHIRQALLEGDWYITSDSFYGEEWDAHVHICKPFRIPPNWKWFRSMDWGYKKHGCIGWFAMDPEGNLTLVKDLIFKMKTDEEMAEIIQDIEKALGLWGGQGSSIPGVADDQLWEQRGASVVSMAETFMMLGVPWDKANKRSRKRNAMILSKKLRDHGDGFAPPGIRFFASCKETIKVIPSVQTDPDSPDEPADGGFDHPHDMVLYACEYASRPEAIPDPGDGEEDDDDRFYSRDSRGNHGYGGH